MLPVREKQPPTEKYVWPLTSKPFETLEESLVDGPSAKLADELVVVDGGLLAIFCDSTLNLPGGDDLVVRSCGANLVELNTGRTLNLRTFERWQRLQ